MFLNTKPFLDERTSEKVLKLQEQVRHGPFQDKRMLLTIINTTSMLFFQFVQLNQFLRAIFEKLFNFTFLIRCATGA